MHIYLNCDCVDEEHELEIYDGSSGLQVGDKLECGRIIQQDDLRTIANKIEEYYADQHASYLESLADDPRYLADLENYNNEES